MYLREMENALLFSVLNEPRFQAYSQLPKLRRPICGLPGRRPPKTGFLMTRLINVSDQSLSSPWEGAGRVETSCIGHMIVYKPTDIPNNMGDTRIDIQKKSKGSKTDPWGSPVLILFWSGKTHSNTAYCHLSDRLFLKQIIISLETAAASSLCTTTRSCHRKQTDPHCQHPFASTSCLAEWMT